MMRREAAVQAAYLAGAQVHAQQAAVALEAMPPRRTWTTQREDRRGGRVGDACSCSQQGTGRQWLVATPSTTVTAVVVKGVVMLLPAFFFFFFFLLLFTAMRKRRQQ